MTGEWIVISVLVIVAGLLLWAWPGDDSGWH